MIPNPRSRHHGPGAPETPDRAPRLSPVDVMHAINRVAHDPVDLGLLAAACGADLSVQPLEPDTRLILAPAPRGPRAAIDWHLIVNARDSDPRQRFSAAHAIGHLALHTPLIGAGLRDLADYRCAAEGAYANPNLTPDHESQANRVAVGILMPQQAVRRRFLEMPDVPDLAAHFRTSENAMRIRLTTLGLIDAHGD